jgi:TetR/AcrR family transcriptional regulator, regulator of cefoperazone and chloramphenicol sensitivity
LKLVIEMTTKDNPIETRQRLLEAAGEVFAEHGFHHATVRDICEKAGANVAAAHYHFGDKEELYAAVFDYAKGCAGDELETRLTGVTNPEERLRVFAHFYLTRFFDRGRPAWFGKLVAQEMIQPTKVLDALVSERIRPNHERLKDIAREIIGRDVSDEVLRNCAFSIAAQWTFYFHFGQIFRRLYPQAEFDSAEIDRLVEHITKFCLAALKEYRP